MVSNGFNKKEVMLEITHRGQVLDVPVSSHACGIGSKDVFCPQWACLPPSGELHGNFISTLYPFNSTQIYAANYTSLAREGFRRIRLLL